MGKLLKGTSFRSSDGILHDIHSTSPFYPKQANPSPVLFLYKTHLSHSATDTSSYSYPSGVYHSLRRQKPARVLFVSLIQPECNVQPEHPEDSGNRAPCLHLRHLSTSHHSILHTDWLYSSVPFQTRRLRKIAHPSGSIRLLSRNSR